MSALTNHDAESSVLGAALLDPAAAPKAAALAESDFDLPQHRPVLAAIKALCAAGQAVDLVTVDGWLAAQGLLDQAGGAGALIRLAQYVPTTANVDAYLRLVREAAQRRAIRAACVAAINAVSDGGQSATEALDRHQARLQALAAGTETLVSLPEALGMFIDSLGEQARAGQLPRAYTGIPALDALTGGICGGKLVVAGARPGVGKSAFALACALATCQKGHRVLFVSLEMDERELMARIIARHADVTVAEIESGRLALAQYESMAAVYEYVLKNQLEFCPGAHTAGDVRHAAYQAHAKGGLALIVVDYIGLLRSGEKAESRRVEIGQITRALKRLAQELRVPVLALSQLNRQSEGGANSQGRRQVRVPTMAELRESGDVEQDANLVILLHRPTEGKDAEEQARIDQCQRQGRDYTVLLLEKNRQGKRGVFPVAFDGAHMRYHRLGVLP